MRTSHAAFGAWEDETMDVIGTPRTREVTAIVDKIRPLLAGREPDIQGAVIADLLALWLAGHHVAGDTDATRKMRAELLAMHCSEVRELITINAKIIGTTP
jgi:hypothetical protein